MAEYPPEPLRSHGVPQRRGFANEASYDPELDTWSMLPDAPITSRCNATSVWTESELIVIGGQDFVTRFAPQVAAYRPDTKAWRLLPEAPPPRRRRRPRPVDR